MDIKTYLVIAWCLSSAGGLTLNNGRYEDVYIIIKETVPENTDLIDRIKEVFTEASQLLFLATHNRVYFGDIKILIPRTWSSHENYITSPTFSSLGAHVAIETSDIPDPHVRGLQICGKGGTRMILPPEFILDRNTKFGPHKNVIVHEWGHLRWGLFDEYPTLRRKDTQTTQKFYLHDGLWNPVGCSRPLTGKIGTGNSCENQRSSKCALNDPFKNLHPDCSFCPDPDQSSKASLMSHQYVTQVTHFCDKDIESVDEKLRHNSDALNMQNLNCRQKSAWEVMREHEDFKEGATQRLPASTNTTPTFTLFHERSDYRVFVLDTSGSMDGPRITSLHQVSSYIISDLLPLYSHLSIVWFSDSATVMSVMTNITSDTVRTDLISQLPMNVSGYTCIGCGIDTAVQVLRGSLSDPRNGEIILISDGENNRGDLSVSVQEAIDAKVIVHTVAVSQGADQTLREISAKTGGKSFYWTEAGSISLASVLTEIVSTGVSSDARAPITHVSKTVKYASNATFTLLLDDVTGVSTKVSVMTGNVTDIHVNVTGPGNFLQIVNADSTSRLTAELQGLQQPGEYEVQITLSTDTRLEYLANSFPSTSTSAGRVVRLSTWLSESKVDVGRQELPVVYASVSRRLVPVVDVNVTALVESDDKNCTVVLLDNGQVPDVAGEDGTYSGYIYKDCLSNGRVNIQVSAISNGRAYPSRLELHLASTVDSSDVEGEVLAPFHRSSLPGELTIVNYEDTEDDDTPPGRITDLEVTETVSSTSIPTEQRNYTVTWSATGDDMTRGQAASYEFRISDNSFMLLNNFTSAQNVSFPGVVAIVPKSSGETEAFTITVETVEAYTKTAFIAIVAVDESGNRGAVSNVIGITVAAEYDVKADVNVYQKQEVMYVPDKSSYVWLFLAVGFGVVCLFGVTFTSALLHHARKQTKKKKKEIEREVA